MKLMIGAFCVLVNTTIILVTSWEEMTNTSVESSSDVKSH